MTMLHGFDVSGFNPNAVRKCDFVFVKASEGASYRSGSFSAQWASAHANAGWRGGYHFARPEASSANSQADRFIDIVQPQHGEGLCLDLEASQLTQSETNAWARAFGDRLRAKAPGVTTVLYMGSGYASNGTGKGLKDHFDFWWYPQYPSTYQLAEGEDVEKRRAANRSSLVPGRTPTAAMTSSWPPAMTPWLPSGLTCGWSRPDLWQFTDNWQSWDASITALTLNHLAAGGQPTPQEETEMIPCKLEKGLDSKTEFPFLPKFTQVLFFADNSFTDGKQVKATAPVTVRYAIHRTDGTWQTGTVAVGRGPKDTKTVVEPVKFTDAAHTDAISVTRVDGDGTESVSFTVA